MDDWFTIILGRMGVRTTHLFRSLPVNQSIPLDDTPSAVSLREPWLRQHLPDHAPAVLRRFIQLVTGIFETRSLLIETIADSTAFRANASSNATHVRRILRDLRLTRDELSYPFVRSIQASVPATDLDLTVDETSHGTEYTVVQIGWATDGMSVPLGMLIYAPNAPWAEATRTLLHTIDDLIPDGMTVPVLADRIHTGAPFLACLDGLSWNDVFRASDTTQIEHPTKGWMPLQRVYTRANTGRYLPNVRLWKQGQRRSKISIWKRVRPGFRPVIWYVVSNLDPDATHFFEYACRWWCECTFKIPKSGQFQWERGRVTDPHRVRVLLMGVRCALWALWLLGREYERIPVVKPTTCQPQRRRHRLIADGYAAFRLAVKRQQPLQMPAPRPPRVLDYQRVFEWVHGA